MQPEIPTPNIGPEQPAVDIKRRTEKTTDFESPKSDNEISAEKYEQRAEANAMIADMGLTTSIPTPVSVAAEPSTTVQTVDPSSSNPSVANDEDLIEKEWVDRAKKIVQQTQNDPHRRDEEVSKLKVDYLKKRYGRELGASG